MTQEQVNIIVRAVVFALSTDCCMDNDALEGGVEALRELMHEFPDNEYDLDLTGIVIYGSDPKFWEDPEINKELLEMLDGKLECNG